MPRTPTHAACWYPRARLRGFFDVTAGSAVWTHAPIRFRSQAMLQPDSMKAETTSLPGSRRNPLEVFTSMFR